MDIGLKTILGMPWCLGYVKLLDSFDWELAHNSHLFGVLIPNLMLMHDIKTVIEIGIDRAWVTHVVSKTMMAINGDGTLYSCDIKQEACNESYAQTRNLPIEHIILCRDSTSFRWATIMSSEIPMLCVVDGNHGFGQALCDFRSCDEAMVEGSFFLAHDYKGEVRDAAELFMSESSHEWTCLVIKDTSPVAIMQKGTSK